MPKKAARPSDTTMDGSAEPEGQNPAKRVRSNQSRVKGKKGALKVVMTLPMDLIWEICTHLDVADLLALSNTSKNFRSVVTGENSASLFRIARERIGMPELLSPMSDLSYATLFFGKGCNLCGKKNAGKPDPSYRARICSGCYKTEFVSVSSGDGRSAMQNQNFCAIFVIHESVHHGRYDPHIRPADVRRATKYLDRKFPLIASYGKNNFLRSSYPDDVIRNINRRIEREETVESDITFIKLCFEHQINDEPLPTPEGEFQTYFVEKLQDRVLRDKDSQALQDWMIAREKQKTEENKKIRNGRREEIETRLKAVGFEESEFQAHEFYGHAQVKTSRPLSDRTYSKNVEPVLREILEENRRKRIRRVLESQYEQLVKSHPEKAYLPPNAIYVQLPALSPTLASVSQNPPATFIVPAAVKTAALEEALQLLRSRREALVRAIVVAHAELAADLKVAGKKKKKEAKKAKEQQKKLGTTLADTMKKTKCTPTEFTKVEDLPLTLPRLPPWIPRNGEDPIVASDEQLATFLETSPLAKFECSKCNKLCTTKVLFQHLSSSSGCQFSPEGWGVVAVEKNEWIAIKGRDQVPSALVRIDKDVLALSLKLQQVIEATPLVLPEHRKLDDLGAEYSPPAEVGKFTVKLHCDCEAFIETDYDSKSPVHAAYLHLMKKSRHEDPAEAKIKSTVDYSSEYRRRWNEGRREKRADAYDRGDLPSDEEDEFGFYGYDSWEDEGMYGGRNHYDYGDFGGGYGWGSDDDEDEEQPRCVIM